MFVVFQAKNCSQCATHHHCKCCVCSTLEVVKNWEDRVESAAPKFFALLAKDLTQCEYSCRVQKSQWCKKMFQCWSNFEWLVFESIGIFLSHQRMRTWLDKCRFIDLFRRPSVTSSNRLQSSLKCRRMQSLSKIWRQVELALAVRLSWKSVSSAKSKVRGSTPRENCNKNSIGVFHV